MSIMAKTGKCWSCGHDFDAPSTAFYVDLAIQQARAEMGMQWIKCSDKMPSPGVAVLASYRNSLGKARTTRAHHAPPFTIEADHWDDGIPDESEDGSFEPEGWWEDGVESEKLEFISDEVTHWMKLPEAPNYKD